MTTEQTIELIKEYRREIEEETGNRDELLACDCILQRILITQAGESPCLVRKSLPLGCQFLLGLLMVMLFLSGVLVGKLVLV